MKSLLQNKIQELFDSIEKRRISRLSRGSVRIQNGYYISNHDWKKMKQTHNKRLKKVSASFYPEKYGFK